MCQTTQEVLWPAEIIRWGNLFIAVCTKVGAAEFSVLFFDHSLNFFVQLAQSTAHRELNKTG